MKAINWWAHKARRMWGNLRLTVNSWPGIDGLSVDSSISCTPSIGQEITRGSASSISCRRIPILWALINSLSYKPTVVDWNSRDRKCIPHRLILSLKHKLSLTVETRTPIKKKGKSSRWRLIDQRWFQGDLHPAFMWAQEKDKWAHRIMNAGLMEIPREDCMPVWNSSVADSRA